MTRRTLIALAAALAVALPAASRADCPVPPELREVSATLPHLARRLRAKQAVTIVAIGGASTYGGASGNPDLAYPHRLQLALAARYSGVAITVINKGVPRQSANQMVERFAADVLREKPALVVWEVGITDAVRGVSIDDFAAALQAGIDQLKKAAIDIVLVDMQFSRKATALIDFERYLDTIHRVGELNAAYVFPRFALMRYWSEQHVFDFEQVAAGERSRLAAQVYECIGGALADAIGAAVR
jgi:hypothetical protein